MSDMDVVDQAQRHLAKRGREALERAEADGRLARLTAATSERALSALTGNVPKRAGWRWLGGVGISAIVVLAGATYVSTRAPSSPTRAVAVVATPEQREEAPTAEAVAPPVAVPGASLGISVDSLPSAPSLPHAQAPRNVPPRADAPTSVNSEVLADSAASLFERANAARHRADDAAAETLYRELLDRYPRSREANATRVIVGRMQLARGAGESALGLFDAYLAESPTGTLTEQALVGRAQALKKLGRQVEARTAWRALLDAFPKSAYRVEALEALDSPR
ncbi:hypothetical protein AKJ09_02187 [Labilithrix luteola]|uniref:Outer membrane lipoprotein BamD-like domain-containing protein n=1 Tax=Labilithrix luteola TaxID=1391654 RepID=A0A0K1PPS0_9BACT|nr:tetratricopeptide repeat protein [Labilithrix luteola]AKU95523.1 hypothetical protein AKJ09_02187 [Labilithrix luteola]